MPGVIDAGGDVGVEASTDAADGGTADGSDADVDGSGDAVGEAGSADAGDE